MSAGLFARDPPMYGGFLYGLTYTRRRAAQKGSCIFMKKILSLLLMAMLLIPGFALADISVTDGMGRAVSFDSAPQTAVSLTPANTEILFALGLGDKVVGVDAYSDYPAEALEVGAIVGDYTGPNLEMIVSLKPDVIFASTTLQSDVVDQLEQLGLKVVCVEPTRYAEVYEGIQLIADVMDADASVLLHDMKAKEEAALAKVIAGESKKVYFALSFGEYGNWSAGPDTFIDEMITLAGGNNVAASTAVQWPEYSMEQLVLDDPDLIVVSAYAPGVAQELMESEGYKDLRCVKDGKVYEIDANTSSRPGPRIVDALESFVELINE